MDRTAFLLEVSHAQIAVLDGPSQLLNDWTTQHVEQGFAWRPGSVSFRTLLGSGTHEIEVAIGDSATLPSEAAIRIIEVPFDHSAGGQIEVVSVMDSIEIDLPAGQYQLRCEFFSADTSTPRIRLEFCRNATPEFGVVRADAELSIKGDLLLIASAAT